MSSRPSSRSTIAPKKPIAARPKGTVVRGILVPDRRFTPWAGIYFTVYFCLPLLLLCLAIDFLLYFVFRNAFDSCYALLCLLD